MGGDTYFHAPSHVQGGGALIVSDFIFHARAKSKVQRSVVACHKCCLKKLATVATQCMSQVLYLGGPSTMPALDTRLLNCGIG